jgi:hypothetical protein
LDDAHDGGHDGLRRTEPSMATATVEDAVCVSGSASHNRSIRFNFLLYSPKFKADVSLTPSVVSTRFALFVPPWTRLDSTSRPLK